MSRKNERRRRNSLRTEFPIAPATPNQFATCIKSLSGAQGLVFRDQPKQQITPPARPVETIPAELVRGLAAIANSAWRAKTKMVDPTTGEPHEPMRRVWKDIERIYRHLEDIGFRVRNHTGDPYDDGQPMKVITSEHRPEVTRKYVITTLLPTLYWKGQIIQHGEVEIAVPSATDNV